VSSTVYLNLHSLTIDLDQARRRPVGEARRGHQQPRLTGIAGGLPALLRAGALARGRLGAASLLGHSRPGPPAVLRRYAPLHPAGAHGPLSTGPSKPPRHNVPKALRRKADTWRVQLSSGLACFQGSRRTRRCRTRLGSPGRRPLPAAARRPATRLSLQSLAVPDTEGLTGVRFCPARSLRKDPADNTPLTGRSAFHQSARPAPPRQP